MNWQITLNVLRIRPVPGSCGPLCFFWKTLFDQTSSSSLYRSSIDNEIWYNVIHGHYIILFVVPPRSIDCSLIVCFHSRAICAREDSTPRSGWRSCWCATWMVWPGQAYTPGDRKLQEASLFQEHHVFIHRLPCQQDSMDDQRYLRWVAYILRKADGSRTSTSHPRLRQLPCPQHHDQVASCQLHLEGTAIFDVGVIGSTTSDTTFRGRSSTLALERPCTSYMFWIKCLRLIWHGGTSWAKRSPTVSSSPDFSLTPHRRKQPTAIPLLAGRGCVRLARHH